MPVVFLKKLLNLMSPLVPKSNDVVVVVVFVAIFVFLKKYYLCIVKHRYAPPMHILSVLCAMLGDVFHMRFILDTNMQCDEILVVLNYLLLSY